MSTSDKKRIRKEQANEFLTERQKAELAEAKKLKIYTISFITAMLLVVCIALGVLGVRAVNNSGVLQKNTIAATIGDQELNSVELNYYFIDSVNQYYSDIYSQFSDYTDNYLEALGLNKEKPLDEQIQDKETGKTWAEYFVDSAVNQAKIDYTMYNLAVKDDFKLSEDEQASLDSLKTNVESYATAYGYSNANQYLRAAYGYGSDLDSYYAYCQRSQIAQAYIAAHQESLTYDNTAIREYEGENKINYNSYTYDYSYLSYTDFRTGGEKTEEGEVTYTDAQNEAARAAAKDAADLLATATSKEEMEKKIKELKVNENSELVVNEEVNQLYTSMNSALAKWVSASERKDGDVAVIPNTSTTENEDGTETTVTNGYYVTIYHGMTENNEKLANVRHLLVEFEHNHSESEKHSHESESQTYTDEEKAAAKKEAEGYLKTWQEGEKTEASFIELVKKHSDDSSATDGGLFEDIHRESEYVENFLNWSVDSKRQPGDCEVIETEYGYHVMYFVSYDELSYRDYMISEEMRSADQEKWYNEIMEPVVAKIGNTSKMNLDITLA